MDKITRIEYENALDVCMRYKSQIDAEVAEASVEEDKLLVDMHYNGEIPTRLYERVGRNLHDIHAYLPRRKDWIYQSPCPYKLSDLLKLTHRQVLDFRLVGKEVLKEFIELENKYKKK